MMYCTPAEYVKEWWGVDLPPTAEVQYLETHCDWSWSSVLIIYQVGDDLFLVDNADEWSPSKVTEEYALEAMIEFDNLIAGGV